MARRTVLAPAKLNLGLRILNLRADGFHNLISVFQTVDMCDTLSAVPTKRTDITLTCSDSTLPCDASNLVVAAAMQLREQSGRDYGADLTLEKKIPHGAGLGGGSSDAAATLRLLDHLWGLELSDDEALEICNALGSDVPFFWQGGTARVSGRGEIVETMTSRGEAAFVVVTPSVAINTGWAYGQLPAQRSDPAQYIEAIDSLAKGELDLLEFCTLSSNDFQEIAQAAHPEIGEIRRMLTDAGAVASNLSGSGSATWGVFRTTDEASVASKIVSERGGWPATVCLPVSGIWEPRD